MLELTRWESAVGYTFLAEKENRAGLVCRTVTEERVQVADTRVSSGTGRSSEQSWAGGMFTND